MALITVYFAFKPGEYVKAIIDENRVDFFVNKGAYLTQKEAIDANAEVNSEVKEIPEEKKVETKNQKEVEKVTSKVEGDLGSGETNSLRFHELKVLELLTFDKIQDYAFKVTGKMIRRKTGGTLPRYRKNAIKLIKGYLNAGQSR